MAPVERRVPGPRRAPPARAAAAPVTRLGAHVDRLGPLPHVGAPPDRRGRPGRAPGRGGAGFPTAVKLAAVRGSAAERRRSAVAAADRRRQRHRGRAGQQEGPRAARPCAAPRASTAPSPPPLAVGRRRGGDLRRPAPRQRRSMPSSRPWPSASAPVATRRRAAWRPRRRGTSPARRSALVQFLNGGDAKPALRAAPPVRARRRRPADARRQRRDAGRPGAHRPVRRRRGGAASGTLDDPGSLARHGVAAPSTDRASTSCPSACRLGAVLDHAGAEPGAGGADRRLLRHVADARGRRDGPPEPRRAAGGRTPTSARHPRRPAARTVVPAGRAGHAWRRGWPASRPASAVRAASACRPSPAPSATWPTAAAVDRRPARRPPLARHGGRPRRLQDARRCRPVRRLRPATSSPTTSSAIAGRVRASRLHRSCPSRRPTAAGDERPICARSRSSSTRSTASATACAPSCSPSGSRLDDWGYPIIDRTEIPPHLEAHARRAATACPTLALLPARAQRLSSKRAAAGWGLLESDPTRLSAPDVSSPPANGCAGVHDAGAVGIPVRDGRPAEVAVARGAGHAGEVTGRRSVADSGGVALPLT